MSDYLQQIQDQNNKNKDESNRQMAKDAARTAIQSNQLQPPASIQDDAKNRSNADLQAADKKIQQTQQQVQAAKQAVQQQPPANNMGIPDKSQQQVDAMNRTSNAMHGASNFMRSIPGMPTAVKNKISGIENDAQAKAYGVTNFPAVGQGSDQIGQYANTEIYGDYKKPAPNGGGVVNDNGSKVTNRKPDITPDKAKEISKTVGEIIQKNPDHTKDILNFIVGLGDAIGKGKSFYAGNYDYKTISEKDLDKLRQVQGDISLAEGLVEPNKANYQNMEAAKVEPEIAIKKGVTPYDLQLLQQQGANAANTARIAGQYGIGSAAAGATPGGALSIASEDVPKLMGRGQAVKNLLQNTNTPAGAAGGGQGKPSGGKLNPNMRAQIDAMARNMANNSTKSPMAK